MGSLVVDTSLRKVQHPSGGVIGEILAREGDRVQAGDVLVRLDATITRANLAIGSKGLDELRARKARLEAERDDRPLVEFPKELTGRTGNPDVAAIMDGERKLFDLRRAARTGQKLQLRQRVAQLELEVEGLNAQAAAKAQEIVLITKELSGARELWEQKLYPITKLTQLEREATRLDGERAQLIAASAQAKGKITETELQIVQVDREFASEVAKELRDTDAKIGEFLERKITAEDQLKRIDIRAPIDGIVHQSSAHTVGGVITANGEPIICSAARSWLIWVAAITRAAAYITSLLYNGITASLIEDVVGGSGDNTFCLSSHNSDNIIVGNGGTDTVYVTYSYGIGYTIQSGSTAADLVMLGTCGTDAFLNCEYVHFSNGVTYSTASLIADTHSDALH